MQSLSPTFGLSAPDWNLVPQVSVVGAASLINPHLVALPTSAGALYISLTEHGVRIRSNPLSDNQYGMLVAEPVALPVTLIAGEDSTTVSHDQWQLQINHCPFAFELIIGEQVLRRSPTDGHFVRRHRIPPLAKTAEGWLFSLDLDAEEPVYGLGEKWGKLDKRGQLLRSYNHDALGVNAEISYKNIPFAWSPQGWGLFIHTPAPVTHAVGFAPWSQRSYAVALEDEHLDLFILVGEQGAAILDSFTELTGKAPRPPLWSLGVILSKAYYKDVPELMETAQAVRDNNMPCDVITLDGRAWQDTDTRFAFEWDPNRFDDPAAVVAKLKDMDFKVCVWEYPLVSVHNPLFNEMAAKGWLLKHQMTGEAYRYQWDQSAFGEVLTPLPESGIVDFTHPDAYAFWKASHQALFDVGVDMIKADFGEQVEDDNMLAHSGDTGHRLHNVYSMLYNRCVYQAAEQYCASGPFLFSRSAWTGSQRYPSQWGGDPQADWGGLTGSIRGALSWGMTGAPFYATDVGGFYKDTRDSELFARWTQVAVFSAHMRLHGIGQREPWSYQSEAGNAATKALQWRYRLLPYIQKCIDAASQTGLPVMRAMPLAFPKERATWAFELQFMFGEDLLVMPCVKPGGDVEGYLPSGSWVRFPEGTLHQGGEMVHLSLALDEWAVFARQGAQIPLGPDVQHTNALGGKVQVAEHWHAGQVS